MGLSFHKWSLYVPKASKYHQQNGKTSKVVGQALLFKVQTEGFVLEGCVFFSIE